MKAFALALAFGLALAPMALRADDSSSDASKDAKGMCCGSKGGMMDKGGMDKGGMMGLMTDQERKEHMDKMRGMKDRESCTSYMQEHHKMMQERASAKGMKMPDMKGDDAKCMKMAKAQPGAK